MLKRLTLFIFFLLPFSFVFAQKEGDIFFAEGTVHEIRFYFAQPGYWDSLIANKPAEIYMKGEVRVDGAVYPNSGVRFKGNSSYNNPSVKKPFKIDFEEFVPDQTHDGLKQLSLSNGFKDPTFLREKLMLDFCNQHGIPAPRATFANLYINYERWGLYVVVEDVGKTFLKQRFDNNDGNLYKGEPHGLLTWKGWDQTLYEADYELKTNETENDWSGLIALLNTLNNTPAAQLSDSLAARLHLDSWFGYWAVHNLFVNLDSYVGSGHNYYLYHNEDTGLFEFITWDVNEAFGNFKMGLNLTQIKTLPFTHIPQPFNQRPLMNRLLQDAGLKQRLADRLCALLQDFNMEKMAPRTDALANLIRPHVQADTKKFYSNTQFEQNLTQDLSTPGGPQGPFDIAGLTSFVTARRNSLLGQLAAFGCTATAVSQAGEDNWDVFPNPVSGRIFVRDTGGTLSRIGLYTLQGQQLKTWDRSSDGVSFDLDGIAAGIYVLQLQNREGRFTLKKIVVQ